MLGFVEIIVAVILAKDLVKYNEDKIRLFLF